jgi:hypothetical protein
MSPGRGEGRKTCGAFGTEVTVKSARMRSPGAIVESLFSIAAAICRCDQQGESLSDSKGFIRSGRGREMHFPRFGTERSEVRILSPRSGNKRVARFSCNPFMLYSHTHSHIRCVPSVVRARPPRRFINSPFEFKTDLHRSRRFPRHVFLRPPVVSAGSRSGLDDCDRMVIVSGYSARAGEIMNVAI